MKLKCYFVGSQVPGEFDFVEAVFAENPNEAKKLAWAHGNSIRTECDGDYTMMRAARKKQFDELCNGEEAYCVWKAEELRKLGWKMEGDLLCASCGLAEMEDKFPVCPICNNCEECGHAADCENKEESK